jgi:2-iminobutanoate/2-iminopropanoate deaminase
MDDAVRLIDSTRAPTPPGPFSHASVVGPFVFTAGMGGLDPATGEVVSDDLREQTRQAMRNTLAILEDAGASVTDIVKVTLYLTDMADYPLVNAIYEECMGQHRPARTCVAVSALPVRERMKLDVVAIRR